MGAMRPEGLTFVQRTQMIVAAQRHQRKQADHAGGDHVIRRNIQIAGLFNQTGYDQTGTAGEHGVRQ